MRALAAIAIILLFAAGCSSAPTAAGRLEAPYPKAFAAARRAAPAPVEAADLRTGRIETGWVEALGARTRGYILEGRFVERRRYEIELSPDGRGTAIDVRVRLEERAPGGAQAARWERVEAPAALGEAVIDRVRSELKK
jgi:hypothetical protein